MIKNILSLCFYFNSLVNKTQFLIKLVENFNTISTLAAYSIIINIINKIF